MTKYKVIMKKVKFRTLVLFSNILVLVLLAAIVYSDNLRYLPIFFLMMGGVYFVWYKRMSVLQKSRIS